MWSCLLFFSFLFTLKCASHSGLSLTTKFSRPQPSHYINKRQRVGSSTVLDPLSEAALVWKSQHSNISAELFQVCYLAGRQAPLLVSVTTVSGYKTLRSTLWIKTLISSIAHHKSPRSCKNEMLEAFSFWQRPNMSHAVGQNQQIMKIILQAYYDYICVYACAWVYCYSL